MLAALLVRGTISSAPQIRETLKRLNLVRKNSVVFLEDTPQVRGMLKVAQGYITYGTVSDEVAKKVIEARAEEAPALIARRPNQAVAKHSQRKELFGKTIKPAIRLSPPRGGFERGGIKAQYSQGGVLGDRKDAMDALLERMI